MYVIKCNVLFCKKNTRPLALYHVHVYTSWDEGEPFVSSVIGGKIFDRHVRLFLFLPHECIHQLLILFSFTALLTTCSFCKERREQKSSANTLSLMIFLQPLYLQIMQCVVSFLVRENAMGLGEKEKVS